jgi:hypothetical protein
LFSEDPHINKSAFSYALQEPQYLAARFNIQIHGLKPNERIQCNYRNKKIYTHEGLHTEQGYGSLNIPGSAVFEKITLNHYSNYNGFWPRLLQKPSPDKLEYLSTEGEFIP